MYPDDQVLIAIMNNVADWERVQTEGWYRIPAKRAPKIVPNFDWLAFYFTAKFGPDKYAIHYYASVEGHELVTRRDLVPDQPNHPRAGEWYYQLMLGPLQHKIPPIVSNKWRRITFIETTGDRFENSQEVNDLFDHESPMGQLYVKLKEEGYTVEQFWTVREGKAEYTVDLAVSTDKGWLPVNVSPHYTTLSDLVQLSDNTPIDQGVAKIRKTIATKNKK
ncbi:MAG: hypothetical protein AAF614_42780 [Chloroflexota bacterium]